MWSTVAISLATRTGCTVGMWNIANTWIVSVLAASLPPTGGPSTVVRFAPPAMFDENTASEK